LVQVATRKGIYLLDPLDGPDLDPLAGLLADPDVETLVHAGRQDFEIFYEAFDVVPRKVFDVQLAAGFAGYGASLPYGRLVEAITKVTLTKGESYTDWCKRPLTESQLRYAADDVRYLHVIADKLKEVLAQHGRTDWVLNEMASLEDPSMYETDPAQAWRRVSGRGTLSGKQSAVLKELAAWREERAMTRDLPRGWIVKDQSLIEIARRRPSDLGTLKGVRGLAAAEIDRSGKAILAAVKRGTEAPPVASAQGPSRSALVRARTLSGLVDALIRCRAEAAGLAPELVTTRGETEAVLAELFSGTIDDSRHRLLQGWRRDLAGSAVLELAEGRIAMRITDSPPYIEEVVVDG
jgi:ribonuclease D